MFLSLGSHPPANAFVAPDRLLLPEKSFPLRMYACQDCGLIQIKNVIPLDYFRHYLYVPSMSDTVLRHFGDLAAAVRHKFGLTTESLVVDIGANDGALLRRFAEFGVRTLGIDPALNLIDRGGVETIGEYFGTETAERARRQYGPAKVIMSTNTLNHVDNVHDFMHGVAVFLDSDGVLILELPHSVDFLAKNEFDTIYHEHLSVFSVQSLVKVCDAWDLEVFNVEKESIHGGSLRVFAAHRGSRRIAASVKRFLRAEHNTEAGAAATYRQFARRVERNKCALLDLLSKLKRQGKRLAGYGAPAKGNTLLNYYGLGTDILEYLVDKNPLKHGLFSPGMRIPIFGVDKLESDQPDYVVILAWNFADEIMREQRQYRRKGGQFIVPIPEPSIVR